MKIVALIKRNYTIVCKAVLCLDFGKMVKSLERVKLVIILKFKGVV